MLASTLNEMPRPVWIAVMVLAFVWHWPIGLAILAYLVGSGRIGRGAYGPGRWYNTPGSDQGATNRCGPSWGKWGNWGPQATAPAQPPSGNRAFDDYRTETLRRLEEEQKEFVEYLERLRQAKDKAEFDQFMADRRRPSPPAPEHG
jgi:hypothetical protein